MSDELEDIKARYERLKLLYHVSHTIHSTLDPETALQLIVREAVRLTRASSGSVALYNPTTGLLEIEASQGLPDAARRFQLRLGEGITGWVVRTGQPARVGEVNDDPRYIMLKPGVRSELAVPLEVRGEVRGALNVDSDRPEAFTSQDQQLLEALALQAATVIQNTWLHQQIRLKARLFETLVSIGQTIHSALNLDEALKVITREACLLMEAKVSSLLLLDETGEWLDLKASYGAGQAYVRKPRLNAAESLLGVVVRRQKPLQLENVQTSNRFQNREVARQEGLVSLLSVPLVYSGQAIGALNVYTDKPHSFSNEEIQILSALSALSAVALEKARLYERVVDVEEQLRQSERLSALGLLAAEVAHEIRNPLTVLKMLYHSLDLNFPPEDPRSKDVEIMGQKMDHLNRIVEQILDFARNAEPTFAPIDLNRLLDDLGLLIRHKLQNQGIKLVWHLQQQLPSVRADAAHLEQAFLNLILNAVQAMPHGGTLTLTTRAVHLPRRSPHPTQVLVEFKDSGEGFTPEQQRRLAGPLLSSSKTKGTGLGLAIVRRVIEAHQGQLRIRSRPGRGTTICVCLPAK